jgi:hypothetical protein
MAGDFGRKLKTDNSHLQGLTSARFVHLDGSVTTPVTIVAAGTACNLQRITLSTNGASVIVKTGTDIIAVIASDAPEGDFDYGVYCPNGLTVTMGGAGDVTVVYDR